MKHKKYTKIRCLRRFTIAQNQWPIKIRTSAEWNANVLILIIYLNTSNLTHKYVQRSTLDELSSSIWLNQAIFWFQTAFVHCCPEPRRQTLCCFSVWLKLPVWLSDTSWSLSGWCWSRAGWPASIPSESKSSEVTLLAVKSTSCHRWVWDTFATSWRTPVIFISTDSSHSVWAH